MLELPIINLTRRQKELKTEILLKLSNLNSNLTLTLGYLNPALNNSALGFGNWNTAHGIWNPTQALLESIMMWIQVLLKNTGIKYLESRIWTPFLWTWKIVVNHTHPIRQTIQSIPLYSQHIPLVGQGTYPWVKDASW